MSTHGSNACSYSISSIYCINVYQQLKKWDGMGWDGIESQSSSVRYGTVLYCINAK
jgi:hypothetical protein